MQIAGETARYHKGVKMQPADVAVVERLLSSQENPENSSATDVQLLPV